MKIGQLKKLIKESVREVIQDELKEILLEAVKAPKQIQQITPQQNSFKQATTQIENKPLRENTDIKTSYLEVLNETAAPRSEKGTFVPTPGSTSLGEGEVDFSQIQGLLNG